MQASVQQPAAPVRSQFTTHDAAEAHAFLCSSYVDNIMRITGSQAGFRMRHRLDDTGKFSVSVMSHTMPVEHTAQPLGYPLIGRVLQGRFRRETAGETLTATSGDVFLIAQPDVSYVASWENVELQMIRVGLGTLAEVADLGPGGLRFASLQPASPGRARHLAATIDYISGALRADPEAVTSPLVLGNTARLLAAAMLSAFPVAAGLDDRNPADSTDASLRTVHHAISFIEANADRDIGAADIAAAAHITLRAVQLAFRRHLDTTPMAYLRHVRLRQARQQLLDADPGRETVAAVASRWGFSSPSAFSAYYRDAYGTLPSRTLHGG